MLDSHIIYDLQFILTIGFIIFCICGAIHLAGVFFDALGHTDDDRGRR